VVGSREQNSDTDHMMRPEWASAPVMTDVFAAKELMIPSVLLALDASLEHGAMPVKRRTPQTCLLAPLPGCTASNSARSDATLAPAITGPGSAAGLSPELNASCTHVYVCGCGTGEPGISFLLHD
jgi:hypothetical protein